MTPHEKEAMRLIVLALDFVLWQMTPGATRVPHEISGHRQALVRATNLLQIYESQL